MILLYLYVYEYYYYNHHNNYVFNTAPIYGMSSDNHVNYLCKYDSLIKPYIRQ